MGDPNNPERIYLTISPPGELDIAREIQRRADGQKDLEWQNFLAAPTGETPDLSNAQPKGITPPIESSSEQVRNQAQAAMDEPVAKKAVNSAFKIMTGMTYDELQKSAEKGELPISVATKLYDPLSSLMEAVATQKAEASALPKDITKHFGTITALASGILFPMPGKKPEALKAAAESAAASLNKFATQRQKLLDLIAKETERVKIGKGEAHLMGRPELEGQIPLGDKLKGLYDQLTALNGKIVSAQQIVADAAGRVTQTAAAGAQKALAGAGLGTGEANINVARVNAAESVKATITKLNKLMAGQEPLKTARETVTHAETIAAGQARGLTIEEALNIPDEELLLESARATQQAIRDLHVKLATIVNDLRAKAMKGDAQAAEDLANAWMVAGKVGVKDELAGKGGGRYMEARKIHSDAERAAFTAEEFALVSEKMGAEGVDGFEIARYLTQIQGTRRRMGFLTTVWKGYQNVQDAFHWLYLQFLLSGPQTHAANIAGTSAIQVLHYPERYVAEWINRAFFQNPDGVQRGETWAALMASGRGASEGLQMMGKAIRTGEQPFGAGRIEARFDMTAKQFGMEGTPLGAIFDAVGMVSPTRLMMGEDAVFKGYVYRTELAALSLAEALKKTTDPVRLGQLAAQLERNPTPEMMRLATEAAQIRTLNNELGTIGAAAQKARNAIPVLGWLIAPFLQTPGNSYNWTYRRAPILSTLSVKNWQDVAAGGRTRDMAMSRMLIGNAIGAAVTYHVLVGDITGGMLTGRVVGGLPVGSNKNLKRDARAVGLEPYTIRVGDEFFGYKRTDPVGQYIGGISTALEIYSQLHAGETDFSYSDFAIAAGLAGSRVALDTPWLSGVSNVLSAMTHPDTDSKRMAQGFARSIVPAAVRTVTRFGVPGVMEGYPEMRELDSLVDVIKADVPWLVTGVAPVLHPITGETIERPPGWGPDAVSPIFVTKFKDDPVLMEIIRNKMNFNEPPKMAWGRQENDWSLDPTLGDPDGVKLTPGQYFTLKYLATTELRDGQGRTMHQAMTAMVGTDEYRRAIGGPDGRKETMLKIIYHNFYARAMLQLRSENKELDDAISAKREYKIRLGGTADSPNAVQPRVAPGLPAALDSMMKSLGR